MNAADDRKKRKLEEKKQRRELKKAKKNALVLCHDGSQFWTTQKQFWQWVRAIEPQRLQLLRDQLCQALSRCQGMYADETYVYVRSGSVPRSDGVSGLRVVRVLEELQRSLETSDVA